MFESQPYPTERILDQHNLAVYQPDTEGVIYLDDEEYHAGYEGRNYETDPYGAGVAKPLVLDDIDPVEWHERIQEMERTKTRLSDLLLSCNIPAKDQDGTNYCWGNGLITAVETIRCVMNQPYVALSAASVCAPIKHYRNRGGSGIQALQFITELGICPESLWPNSLEGINRRLDNHESRQERQKYKITEWCDILPRNKQQVMNCLLRKIPVPAGYNFWGHLVCLIDPVIYKGDIGFRFRNSWKSSWGYHGFGILAPSVCVPDDACCPLATPAA